MLALSKIEHITCTGCWGWDEEADGPWIPSMLFYVNKCHDVSSLAGIENIMKLNPLVTTLWLGHNLQLRDISSLRGLQCRRDESIACTVIVEGHARLRSLTG